MLKWLIRNRLAAFERQYEYDTSYARDLLAADTRAFFAYARLQGMTKYDRDVPKDVYHAVKLVGTIAEDCGPCTQLNVAMGLRAGVEPRTLSAVVRGDEAALSPEVRLGVRYARAVLAHDAEADTLREEIVQRWGRRALIACAFALTTARMYPTLKYALGHGAACQRVVVAGEPVGVVRSVA